MRLPGREERLRRLTDMRIILVRHGRSAHVHSGWLDHEGIHAWREKYDAAGLAAGETPPAALRDAAARAGLLVASDLPRAIESASLLCPGCDVVQSPLLREVPLPVPRMARVQLPLSVWGSLIGLAWMRDLATGRDELHGPARARAAEAAAWLSALAAQRGNVMAVTHGAFRRYLFDTLRESGWRASAARRTWRHWSAWELERG